MRKNTRQSRNSSLSSSFIKRLSSWLVLSTVLTLAAPEVPAATLFWDPIADNDTVIGGAGTWDTSTAQWDPTGTDPAGPADNVVWVNANSDTAVFGGAAGPFTVDISGAVTAGGLTFASADYTISATAGTLTLDGGAVALAANFNATISAAMAGGAGLTGVTVSSTGAGVLTFTGANTYTLATTVTSGELALNTTAANSLSGNLVVAGGTARLLQADQILDTASVSVSAGTFAIGAFNETVNGVQMTGGSITGSTGALTSTTAFDLQAGSVSAILAGTVGLDKTTAGTVTLSGVNTFDGNIAVQGGTLEFGADTNLGNVNNDITLTNNAVLNYTSGNGWDPAGSRTITIGSGGGTLSHAVANQGIRITDVGQLTGSGTLTKAGAGILQSTVANTGFTGNINVNGGVLEISNSQAFGTGAGQTLTVGASGEMTVDGGANRASSPYAVVIGGAGARLSFDNGNAGNFAGTISAPANFTVSLKDFFGGTGRSGSITGVISGAGQATVDATGGAQDVRLYGNNTAWTGGLSISNNARVRAVNGASADVLGSGTVTLNGGTLGLAPMLTAAGGTTGFSGRYFNSALIGNGVIGGFDFGLNTAVLTRTEANLNLPSAPAGVNTNSFGALYTGILEITTAGAYTFFTNTDDGSLLYIDGQPVVQNDFSQAPTERSGVTSLEAGFHTIVVKWGGGGGGNQINANYQGADTGDVKSLIGSIGSKLTHTGTTLLGAVTTDNAINVAASSTIELSATTAISNGALTFGSSGLNLTVVGLTGNETLTQSATTTLNGATTITTGMTQVSNGAANALSGADVVLGDVAGGAASLIKAGPRSLTLGGTSSFTGGITLNGGTLRGTALGFNNNAISSAASTAVIFDQVANGTYSGILTGSATLTKNGAGILSLNAANNYSGLTTVTAGTLTGTGSVTSAVTVNALASIAGATGATFGTGALTLNPASSGNFALGAPSLTSLINATGQLTVGLVTMNFTNGGGLTAGAFRLVDYTGTALTSSQFAGLNVGSQPGGFFITLVNNSGNTSVDAAVAAAAAFNTWTGSVNGIWDIASTANWSSGTYTDGEQVIFPSLGPVNRTITGVTVAPQSITVDTTGGNYSIANNITGTLAGALNKNGTGTLTLTGNNTFSGKVAVNAGTVSANVTSAASSLGSGVVQLNGGTLSLIPVATSTVGLSGAYFTGSAGSVAARDYSGTPTATRIESGTNSVFSSAAIPAPGVGTVNGGNLDNFGALYTGKFFVSTAGPQTFAISSDDGTRVFIDGVPVIINEGASTSVMFTATVNLTAGSHDIRVQYNQGGGGANFRFFTPNGTSLNGLTTADNILLGNALDVAASSTVDLAGTAFTTTGFNLLSQAVGTTLTVAGEAGKQLRFGSSGAAGSGTLTINNTPDVSLGAVTAPGVTLVKQGVGRLILDNTSATASNFTGSTIQVSGGKLVVVGSTAGGATNPLGTAVINLNGGGLFLDSKTNGPTFANSVTLTANATIESLPAGTTTTLGSGANFFNLGANNLTIDTYAGAVGSIQGGNSVSGANTAGSTLQILSPLTGSGTITKTSSKLSTANVIVTNQNLGMLTLNANSPGYSGNLVIDAGTLQLQGTGVAAPKPAGTGSITINTQPVSSNFVSTTNPGNSVALGSSLNLRGNSTGSATTTVFGNNLALQGTGTQVTIDVNRVDGGNSNNIIQMGALTIGGSVNQLNVTGGNTYFVGFDPTTATTLPTGGFIVNATSGNIQFGQNLTTAGTLTKYGAGIMRLDGTNTLVGLSIQGGVLAITNQAAVPTSFTVGNAARVSGLTAPIIQLAGAGGSFADNGTPANNLVSFTATSNYGIRFDNSLGDTTNAGGRWGDTTALVLRSSVNNADSLALIGNATTDYNETVGNISFSGGQLIGFRTNFANRNATLTASGLTRVGGGTIEFGLASSAIGLGATGGQAATLHGTGGAGVAGARFVITGTAPARGTDLGANTMNMVTPTIVNATTSNFVDYAPADALGFNDVTYAAGDVNTVAANSITNSAATAVTADKSLYALKVTGALTSSVGGTLRTVTITGDQTGGNDGTAGLIVNNNTAFTVNNADVRLVFGSTAAPREAVINDQTGNQTIGGPILATGLTKNGGATLIMGVDQTRANAGAANATGLEGDIVVNRGGLSLRTQNSVGKGGTAAPNSGTTRIILAGGTLETRLDTATTFGAGSGGSAYDIIVRANSTISAVQLSAGSISHNFGNLSFEPTADLLRVAGSNNHRIVFTGTTAINLLNTTSFDVTDNGGSTINSNTSITTRAAFTGPGGFIKTGAGKMQSSAVGASMTFAGGTRIEQGALLFEYTPATAVAGALQFGTGAITITGQGSFGIFGNAAAGAATTNVDFSNTVNIVDFGGGFHFLNATAFQQLRFTGNINLAAPMLIGNGGGATAGNNPQYGTTGNTFLTIDQAVAGSRMVVLSGSKDQDFNGNIVDGAGGAGNALVLQAQSGNNIFINGAGSTYAGGTRILAAPNNNGGPNTGRIEVGAAGVLGAGDVFVDGGILAINAVTNVAPTKTITLLPAFGSSGMLTLRNMDATQAQLAALIGAGSRNGIIALSNGTPTTQALNLSALGNGTLFLGANLTNTTYNATTLGAGAGGVYRVGGGFNTLTIANTASNIFTSTNSLQVGNGLFNGGLGNGNGNVTLNNSNNFSGGTVVDFGSGTFTVSSAGGLGTGGLTNWSGTTTISAAQTITAPFIYGGTVNSNALNALGTGAINIGAGTGLSVGPIVAFGVVEQTYSQINLLANATLRPNLATTITGALSIAQANTTFTVNGQNVLILEGGAATGAGVATSNTVVTANPLNRSVNTSLAISNYNQIGSGNINLNGGVLIAVNGVGLGGRVIGGTASNQIQLNTVSFGGNGGNNNFNYGGGFAARGSALTIGNADVVSTSTFDRDFTLGSAATRGGLFYANAPVNLNANTVFTARRFVTIAATGPGLTRLTNATNSVVNTIGANLSGAGTLIFRSNQQGTDAQSGEVVLSGTNTMSGTPTEDFDGGGNTNWVSAGPGGMLISTGPSNPGEMGDVFVRFNGQASLPNRASGSGNAYLMANRYGNSSGSAPQGRSGYLLTGSALGTDYALNTNYRFVLGGIFNTPSGATLGVTSENIVGGSASLDNSIVTIAHSGGAAATLTLLSRDGFFNLGKTTGSAGTVRFQSADLANNGGTDPGLASAASALTNSAGLRTINTRGAGTAILNNIDYRQQDNVTDSSSLFTWLLGGGAARVYEGAVREVNGTVGTMSMINAKVRTQGGTIEIGATPRASYALSTAVGFIDLSGPGGGGFAAIGTDRSIPLNGGVPLTWGTGNTAQWVASGQPFIFGSPNADKKITLTNDITLVSNQTVAAVRATATATPVGQLSGVLSGAGGLIVSPSSFGLTRPDGTALSPGSLILSNTNTYAGLTRINAGTVTLTGGSAIPNTSAVTVQYGANTGTLDLAGTPETIGSLSGGGAVTLGSGGGNLTTGANNTSSFFTGTISGTGSVTKTGSGIMTVASGQSYVGNTVISGGTVKLQLAQAGLIEGRVAGAFNTADSAPNASTQLSARYANIFDNGSAYPVTSGAWADNTTFVYTGYINNASVANATWRFAEIFDDSVLLLIDGAIVLNDTNAGSQTTGDYTLTPGFHAFEIRLGQGTGGVGPTGTGVSGTGLGFAYSTNGGTTFQNVLDNGTGSFLKTSLSSATADLLPTGTALSLTATGATLDLNGINQTVASLAGVGGSAVMLGAGTLTAGDATSTAYSGVISGAGGKLTKLGAGTLTLDGTVANTYGGLTTVSNGVLALAKSAGVASIAGNGLTDKITDILVNGGTLRWDTDNQVGDLVAVSLTSGAVSVNGKTDTFYDLLVSGGTFTTGVGAVLTVTDPTLSGGTSTITAASTATFGVLNISGGTNTVQGRGAEASPGVLTVGAGGLNFSGTASPTLTLASDPFVAGSLVLSGNVTSTVTAGTALIANGGADAVKGAVNINGATRVFNVADGSASVDLRVTADVIGTGGSLLEKTGLGTLDLDGALSVAVLKTQAGITNINGSFTNGTSIVNANATTNFTSSQKLGALNIGTVALGGFAGGNGGSSAVVPEPGSIGLLLIGALGLLGRRRRENLDKK